MSTIKPKPILVSHSVMNRSQDDRFAGPSPMHLAASYDALGIMNFAFNECSPAYPGISSMPHVLNLGGSSVRQKIRLQPVGCTHSLHHPTLNPFPNRPH